MAVNQTNFFQRLHEKGVSFVIIETYNQSNTISLFLSMIRELRPLKEQSISSSPSTLVILFPITNYDPSRMSFPTCATIFFPVYLFSNTVMIVSATAMVSI